MNTKNLPKKTIFNLAKGTTTIIFEVPQTDDRPNAKRAYTAKCSPEDMQKFDKKIGWLIAYLHYASKTSKKEVNRKYETLFSKPVEFQITFLMGIFCFNTGLSLENAEKFIASALR